MAQCQINKIQKKKFEKIQDDVAQLDANFLVGKVNNRVYKNKRSVLKKRFEVMKKRINKC